MTATQHYHAKPSKWLRWVAVLPAALVAGFCVSRLADMVCPAEPRLMAALITQVPMGAAFVIAGARTAPFYSIETSKILALVCFVLAAVVHVLLPENAGFWNYADLIVTAVGASVGAAVIYRTDSPR